MKNFETIDQDSRIVLDELVMDIAILIKNISTIEGATEIDKVVLEDGLQHIRLR